MAGPTTISKSWAPDPIEVGDWQVRYCASTFRYWQVGEPTLHDAIRKVVPTDEFPLLSLGVYLTRATKKAESGVYFQMYLPTLDESDHDLTKDLEVFDLRNVSRKVGA